jgi:ABC-type Na+ efflux pump permease subunit
MAVTHQGHTLWAIAKRAAVEALHDQMTVIMSLLFSVAFPFAMVVLVVRPIAGTDSGGDVLPAILAGYVLLMGMMPTTSAVGVAAGQFAGEREEGCLAPLLASPASNLAIFGGKVLGAVIPALLFAVVAECVYLASIALVVEPAAILLIPWALGLAMLGLVPGVAVFAALLASLISSRVRTFNAAQQISGILLLPLWAGLFGVAFEMRSWGAWTLALAVVVLYLLDVTLTLASAGTWRREEVLARI